MATNTVCGGANKDLGVEEAAEWEVGVAETAATGHGREPQQSDGQDRRTDVTACAAYDRST